jgi:hypothetical protein
VTNLSKFELLNVGLCSVSEPQQGNLTTAGKFSNCCFTALDSVKHVYIKAFNQREVNQALKALMLLLGPCTCNHPMVSIDEVLEVGLV